MADHFWFYIFLSRDPFLFYEKPHGDSFVDFLRVLHNRYGKVLLFVGNALYHKSKKVKYELERLGGDVVLEYFLPYTPELNPIEGQWQILKRAVANTLYDTVDDMKELIWKMLSGGEARVAKMSRYLTL